MWRLILLELLLLPIIIPACGPKNKKMPLIEATQSEEDGHYVDDDSEDNGIPGDEEARAKIENKFKFDISPHVKFPKICPPQHSQSNKNLVVTFYQRTIGDKNLDNLDFYLHEDFIQHNPDVADGIEGFREFFRSGVIANEPRVKINFQRVSAEDDLVWVHTRARLGGKMFAIVDIFRVDCGKIAEHWDVLQEITPSSLRNSMNRHPFF